LTEEVVQVRGNPFRDNLLLKITVQSTGDLLCSLLALLDISQ
jgi:hypothetical protein